MNCVQNCGSYSLKAVLLADLLPIMSALAIQTVTEIVQIGHRSSRLFLLAHMMSCDERLFTHTPVEKLQDTTFM